MGWVRWEEQTLKCVCGRVESMQYMGGRYGDEVKGKG